MKPERCPTCGRRHRRSNQANARLWLLYHAIADHVKPKKRSFSAGSWHLYLKTRFLGCDDVPLPNGEVLLIPRSTAELDTNEFAEYMTKVEAWAAEHDVWLADMEGTG
jgi:hypothetical protein